MNNLEKLIKINVKHSIIEKSITLMRSQGLKGNEIFMYWLGKIEKDVFIVSELYVPQQLCYKSHYGVGVQIINEDIEKMNRYLYLNELINLVQLHSHPNVAYHSQADDDMSIMVFPGQISIVAPNFGFDFDMELSDMKVFRMTRKGRWRLLSKRNVLKLFKVKNNE